MVGVRKYLGQGKADSQPFFTRANACNRFEGIAPQLKETAAHPRNLHRQYLAPEFEQERFDGVPGRPLGVVLTHQGIARKLPERLAVHLAVRVTGTLLENPSGAGAWRRAALRCSTAQPVLQVVARMRRGRDERRQDGGGILSRGAFAAIGRDDHPPHFVMPGDGLLDFAVVEPVAVDIQLEVLAASRRSIIRRAGSAPGRRCGRSFPR
jgi:hypothetical protein